MEVGAHTRTHVDLTKVDDAAAHDQIAGSKRELEDALGVPVRHFCSHEAGRLRRSGPEAVRFGAGRGQSSILVSMLTGLVS